jgi:hypothetical protein
MPTNPVSTQTAMIIGNEANPVAAKASPIT